MRLRRPDSIAVRRKTLPAVRIAVRPGHRSRGILTVAHRTIPVVLGRAGIRADKREGDGATPAGRFRPLRLWWRADRGPRPQTLLPIRRIGPDLAWCEDPADRLYNRSFRRSANEPGDRLWRDDRLYDLIVEIDHNARPRVAGRGSAVFLHIARPDRGPTAGCIAMGTGDLRCLLRVLSPRTRIKIHFNRGRRKSRFRSGHELNPWRWPPGSPRSFPLKADSFHCGGRSWR